VSTLELNENLLADLTQFNKARRDDDGTEIQAFVAECNQQIVGVAVIRREEVRYAIYICLNNIYCKECSLYFMSLIQGRSVEITDAK
jgi:hypothetical protein